MNLKPRNIPFSPPDMSEAEAKLASEAILSGWITTGPKNLYVSFGNGIALYYHIVCKTYVIPVPDVIVGDVCPTRHKKEMASGWIAV